MGNMGDPPGVVIEANGVLFVVCRGISMPCCEVRKYGNNGAGAF